jgi:hypothetical protein
MSRDHLKLRNSAEWREVLRDAVLSHALTGAALDAGVLEVGPGLALTTELLLGTRTRPRAPMSG